MLTIGFHNLFVSREGNSTLACLASIIEKPLCSMPAGRNVQRETCSRFMGDNIVDPEGEEQVSQ